MWGGVAIQTDGKIVAAGATGSADIDFTLARYRTRGRRDTDVRQRRAGADPLRQEASVR